MIKKILFITLISILFPSQSICAQGSRQATLQGRVTGTDNEPLAYVTIYIKGTTIGTSSAAEGNYSLTVPRGKHTLVAQMIGYKTITS